MGWTYRNINKFSEGRDIVPGSDEYPDTGTATSLLSSDVESYLLKYLPEALLGIKRRTITYYDPEMVPILALIPRNRSVRIILPGTADDYPDVAGLKVSEERIDRQGCMEYLFKDIGFKDTVIRLVKAAISHAGHEIEEEPVDGSP